MPRPHLFFSVAAVAMLAPLAARADDEALRKQVLALNSITGDEAVKAKILELGKDKAAAEKLIKQATEMAKLDSKQFKYVGARVLALTAYQIKDYEAALRFYRINDKQARDLKSATKMVEAFDGQTHILQLQKKYEEAEEVCNKLLDVENEELERMKPFIMEELIQIKTRQGKVDEAIKLTEALVKADDAGWYFVRLKGWVLHEAGRSEEASKAYVDAIERLEKSDGLKPDEQEKWVDRIRYQLSNVFVEMGQVEKSVEQLKALLKRKPDSPSYNNDLGYIWADHDMNLEEAEKLIRKALVEDKKLRDAIKDLPPADNKDNAAYLDSLGWVLYKKKQYAEAKKPLLDAVKEDDGKHLEIYDHLADVQTALGEKAEAIATWKKALDLDANTRRDLRRRAEIIKKLKAAEGKDTPAPVEKK